jgi:hypothetical protein
MCIHEVIKARYIVFSCCAESFSQRWARLLLLTKYMVTQLWSYGRLNMRLYSVRAWNTSLNAIE